MAERLIDIMTRKVATVRPEQTIQEVAKIMNQYDVGGVPVVDDSGQCVGIVTDRDIATRAIANNKGGNTIVKNVMTHNIVAANSQTDIHEAANLMATNQIRRLPIVDNNQLTGIVSLGDLAVKDIYENEAGSALSNISKVDHT